MKRLGYQPIPPRTGVTDRIVSSDQAKIRALRGTSVDTVFDVGAYNGCSIKTLRRDFPKARIYSFEPSPKEFQQVKEVADHDGNAEAYQLALSDKPGEMEFHLHGGPWTNSLLKMHKEAAKWVGPGDKHVEELFSEKEAVQVPVTTVDLFCKKHQIDRINLLKVDAQGADLQVLKGASQMISEGKIDVIYTEFNTFPHYEGQAAFHEIFAYIHKHNYKVFDIYQAAYSRGGVLLFGDALFYRAPLESHFKALEKV